jgi:serine/threonine protein phosphatase PrpC
MLLCGSRPGELCVCVAWAGDSPALLLSSDGSTRRLTAPLHTPDDPTERARLLAAGGELRHGRPLLRRRDGRHVTLAMSRSIGDFEQSEGTSARPSLAVTSTPSLTWHAIGTNDQLLLLCSDGVTDVLSDAAAARAAAAAAPFADAAAAAVVRAAATAGTSDDATAVAILFTEHTEEEAVRLRWQLNRMAGAQGGE